MNSSSTNSITLNGLSSETYYFALRSFNGNGESWFSNELQIYRSSGTLSNDEVWSGPRTLTGNVTIPAGVTLTIEPGATINVPSGRRIIVQGTLIAKGTSSQRIRFNRSGPSRWYGIQFDNSSDDQKCILEYCNIINAIYGVYCRSASPKIINCNLNSNMLGIYCYNLSTEQTIQYNNISNNSTWGFYCITPVMPKSNIII